MPRKQALKLIFLPTNNQIKVACLAHQDTLKLTYIILEFQKFSGGQTPGLPLDGECHYPTSGSHGKVRKMRDCGGIMRRRGGGRWPEPNKLVAQETVNPSSATGAK